jgi:Spy/CpxP family protein refolding chaperone
MTLVRTLFLALLFVATQASAQAPGPDPIAENLFPPDLVMQNQQAIALTDAQKEFLKGEVKQAQGRFTDLQFQLQEEMEKLVGLLKPAQPDEQRVLAQLDRVLAAEREIKRAQIALVVRIKDRLTPDQQAKLRELRPKQPPR